MIPSSRRGARFQASPIRFWCSVRRTDTDRSSAEPHRLLRHEAASSDRIGRDRRRRVTRTRSEGLRRLGSPPARPRFWMGGCYGGSMEFCLRVLTKTGDLTTTRLIGVQPEGAARLVGVLAGGSPASGTCPVATVAISGGGTGDQSAGSPDVKVPVGWVNNPVSSVRGASNSTGRSDGEPLLSPEMDSPREAECGGGGNVPRPSLGVEGQCHRRRNWVHAAGERPGVSEGDMPRQKRQRKPGTSRGSPRR